MTNEDTASAEVPRSGPRFQFSLATLMAVVTGVSVFCGLAASGPTVVIPVFLFTAGPVTGLILMRKISLEMPYLGDATLWSGAVTSVTWAVYGCVMCAMDYTHYSHSVDAIYAACGWFLGGVVTGFYAGILLGAGAVFLASPPAICWRWLRRWMQGRRSIVLPRGLD